MKIKEKNNLLKWAGALSDEELEKEYYKAVDDSLGSQLEEMYEQGYDMRDITEQETHEKYLCEKAGILQNLCEERGIKLWKKQGGEQSGK